MASTFQNGVMYACFAVLALLACVCAFVGFRQVGRWLRARLCPIALVVLGSAAIIATCDAQKRGNEAARAPLPRGEYTVSVTPRSVGEAELLPLPGAVTNAKWRARGAFEDAFYIRATNWWARMPDGRWMDRLRILSSGGFRARGVGGGAWTNSPPPFTQKLSLAPEANWPLLGHDSSFWHATTPSNTLVVSWIGGLYARSHTNLVDFQAEIFNDGSLDYRYADRTEHFAASLPFDLDGDGLENSVDPDPLTAGPDAHGTNAEWYNTVCSNVLEAVASGSTGTTGILPVGNGGTGATGILPVDGDCVLSWRAEVNSNAYYFVDVVAERGPAPIYFTGDRESRLGNPVVVALAGVTNRVPLLIGVDYAVTSDTPFTVSFPIDYIHPTVTTNGVADYSVHWPLNFVFTESIGASNRTYMVAVEPYDPGGVFEWGDSGGGVPIRGDSFGGGCRCVSYGTNSATFTCSRTCTCGGDCKARGRYLFESAEIALECGECRCGLDDPPGDEAQSQHDPTDGPSLTITFSKAAVIFEDAYEDYPDVVRPRRSTRVRLTVDAYGGPEGGTLSLLATGLEKLTAVDGHVTLPFNQQLAEGAMYHASGVYEDLLASGSERDVIVSGSLVPSGQVSTIQADARLTAVRIEIKENTTAIANPFVHRRLYGIGEDVKCIQHPSAVSVQWRTAGGGSFSDGDAKLFSCPLTAETSRIYAEYASATLPIALNVIEPERIACDYAEFLPPSSNEMGCGMYLYLVVHPFTVSFSNLKIEEIPADLANWQQWSSHSGYFDDYSFYHRWCHTIAWGAGIWHQVDSLNSIGFDTSRIWTWPQPWSTGTLSWTIPYGWKHKDSGATTPVGQINPPSYSVWTMSSSFLEKTKHSHRIGVTSDGQMYFEGNLQNGNQ